MVSKNITAIYGYKCKHSSKFLAGVKGLHRNNNNNIHIRTYHVNETFHYFVHIPTIEHINRVSLISHKYMYIYMYIYVYIYIYTY